MTPKPPPAFLAKVRVALEEYAASLYGHFEGVRHGATQVDYVADRVGVSRHAAHELIALIADEDRARRDAQYTPGLGS